jgi:hypothetical protein
MCSLSRIGAQMRHEDFLDEELRPTFRIHQAADHAMIFWVNVGSDRPEGDPLALNQGAVIGRCGENWLMAPLGELACKAEVGVHISQRAEAGDDDALPYTCAHVASISPEADRRTPRGRLL